MEFNPFTQQNKELVQTLDEGSGETRPRATCALFHLASAAVRLDELVRMLLQRTRGGMAEIARYARF